MVFTFKGRLVPLSGQNSRMHGLLIRAITIVGWGAVKLQSRLLELTHSVACVTSSICAHTEIDKIMLATS